MYLQIVSKSIFTIDSPDIEHKRNFDINQGPITVLKMTENYCSIIQIYILSITLHIQNVIEIHKLIHKVLSINKTLMSTKGHKSVENWPKVTYARYNKDLVYINAYAEFYHNSSIYSEDSEKNKTQFLHQSRS